MVLHQDDSDKDSFIWRGPALYLKEIAEANKKEDPVIVYRWRKRIGESDYLSEADFSDAVDLDEKISGILSHASKTESMDSEKLGHVMLLMLDLLFIARIVTLDDLIYFLNILGISLSKSKAEQHMSLLVSLNLASKLRYGNNVFYLFTQDKPWLSLGYKDTAKIRDIDRWRNRFTEYYEINEIQKIRALRSYMKSKEIVGD